MWPLEFSQCFPLIWPCDLVFDPTWPSFNRDPDFIERNLLTEIDENLVKTVTSTVFTRFSFNLTLWPSFRPTWSSFERDPELIETNILTKLDKNRVKTVTYRVFTRFSINLTPWPSFWPHVTQFRKGVRFHKDKHSDHDWWESGQNCDL